MHFETVVSVSMKRYFWWVGPLFWVKVWYSKQNHAKHGYTKSLKVIKNLEKKKKKKIINPSFHHVIIPSFNHSIIISFHYSIIPSFHHSIIPSFYHSTILSFHHSIIPSFHHSIIPSFHHSIFPSFHHCIVPSFHPHTLYSIIYLIMKQRNLFRGDRMICKQAKIVIFRPSLQTFRHSYIFQKGSTWYWEQIWVEIVCVKIVWENRVNKLCGKLYKTIVWKNCVETLGRKSGWIKLEKIVEKTWWKTGLKDGWKNKVEN